MESPDPNALNEFLEQIRQTPIQFPMERDQNPQMMIEEQQTMMLALMAQYINGPNPGQAVNVMPPPMEGLIQQLQQGTLPQNAPQQMHQLDRQEPAPPLLNEPAPPVLDVPPPDNSALMQAISKKMMMEFGEMLQHQSALQNHPQGGLDPSNSQMLVQGGPPPGLNNPSISLNSNAQPLINIKNEPGRAPAHFAPSAPGPFMVPAQGFPQHRPAMAPQMHLMNPALVPPGISPFKPQFNSHLAALPHQPRQAPPPTAQRVQPTPRAARKRPHSIEKTSCASILKGKKKDLIKKYEDLEKENEKLKEFVQNIKANWVPPPIVGTILYPSCPVPVYRYDERGILHIWSKEQFQYLPAELKLPPILPAPQIPQAPSRPPGWPGYSMDAPGRPTVIQPAAIEDDESIDIMGDVSSFSPSSTTGASSDLVSPDGRGEGVVKQVDVQDEFCRTDDMEMEEMEEAEVVDGLRQTEDIEVGDKEKAEPVQVEDGTCPTEDVEVDQQKKVEPVQVVDGFCQTKVEVEDKEVAASAVMIDGFCQTEDVVPVQVKEGSCQTDEVKAAAEKDEALESANKKIAELMKEKEELLDQIREMGGLMNGSEERLAVLTAKVVKYEPYIRHQTNSLKVAGEVLKEKDCEIRDLERINRQFSKSNSVGVWRVIKDEKMSEEEKAILASLKADLDQIQLEN